MKVRVKFRKYGPVRFIGHLDVMRFFQKALRRAEIDVKYTTGFNPHQIMTFASPLGVGLESNGEYLDIECNTVTASQDMKERLNRASVPGLEILSVRQIPESAGNAMASVATAKYTLRFREGRVPECADWATSVNAFLAQEVIMAVKETKRGTRKVDIKPGIYDFSLTGSPDSFSTESAGCQNGPEISRASAFPVIRLWVDASSAGNIKPIKVMETFCAFLNVPLAENALMITREELYANIGTPETPSFISLEEVGEDITEPPACPEPGDIGFAKTLSGETL